MNPRLGFTLGAFVLCGTAGIALATAPAPSKAGSALYERYGCYGCHGHSGAGSASGPTLADRGFTAQHVLDYVRRPKGVMPPYHPGALGDAELQAIATYVVSMHATVPLAKVPQLVRLLPKGTTAGTAIPSRAADASNPQGAATFAANCAACHGATGSGSAMAPSLLGEGSKRSAAQIETLILDPPEKMPKLSPDPIPEAQLKPLAQYVAALGAR